MSDPGSSPAPPPPEHHGLDERQKRQLIRLGIVVVIAILVVAFIFQNTRRVKVSFVFFTSTTSLIWVIVLSLVAGALAALLVPGLVRRYMDRRRAG